MRARWTATSATPQCRRPHRHSCSTDNDNNAQLSACSKRRRFDLTIFGASAVLVRCGGAGVARSVGLAVVNDLGLPRGAPVPPSGPLEVAAVDEEPAEEGPILIPGVERGVDLSLVVHLPWLEVL